MLIMALHQVPSLTRERYEEVVRRLTGDKSRIESPSDLPFDGLLVHVAGEGKNGFCIVDIFESEDAVEGFNEAMGSIPREVGIEEPPEFFPAHTFVFDTAGSDLTEFRDEYHAALDGFFRGDPAPAKRLYSHRDDVSLANPFGPVATGWKQVEETMERAASNYRDGGATGFDTLATYVTPELAYLVEVERFEAKISGQESVAYGALRVTSILRPEDGAWKIVHRHADPITAPRPAESVIQG